MYTQAEFRSEAGTFFSSMNLQGMLEARGHVLKRKGAGEYSTHCPWCGGEDRFCVWLDDNRYWCRQCGRKGDSIQFLRDFEGLPFKEAATVAGQETNRNWTRQRQRQEQRKDAGKIKATYDYTDEAGNLLFQVVRYDPKTSDKGALTVMAAVYPASKVFDW